MSSFDRDSILEAIAELRTVMKEREKAADFIRKLLLAFMVLMATSLVSLIQDHFKLEEISNSVKTIKPEHDQMWFFFKREG